MLGQIQASKATLNSRAAPAAATAMGYHRKKGGLLRMDPWRHRQLPDWARGCHLQHPGGDHPPGKPDGRALVASVVERSAPPREGPSVSVPGLEREGGR